MWSEDKIIRKEPSKRKVKITIKEPHQELWGNTNLRFAPCINLNDLDAHLNLNEQEVDEFYKADLITLKNNHR